MNMIIIVKNSGKNTKNGFIEKSNLFYWIL